MTFVGLSVAFTHDFNAISAVQISALIGKYNASTRDTTCSELLPNETCLGELVKRDKFRNLCISHDVPTDKRA